MGVYEFDQPDERSRVHRRALHARRRRPGRSTSTSTATCSRSATASAGGSSTSRAARATARRSSGSSPPRSSGSTPRPRRSRTPRRRTDRANVVFHAADAASRSRRGRLRRRRRQLRDDRASRRPAGVPRGAGPDPAARRAAHPLHARPRGLRAVSRRIRSTCTSSTARELTALLKRHFGWVAVGGQRSDAGSSIAFPTAVQSPQAASFFDRDRRDQLPRLGRAAGARLPDRARDQRAAARGRPEHALRPRLPARSSTGA